ncbi:MAG: M55 family metallopeptidase [Chloroflexi bacterium]|nr:M55 family metallopeptidase [Chloroflexota bacterium]
MKIYIMTDMEGVAGILDHDNWCQPPERSYPGRYYDLGRELLTREVNAAIEGLWQGGAEEIVVADGHGAGGIVPPLLDRRAKLMRGWPRGYPLELDPTFDGVCWVGQHAKASTPYAHLAHTQWFNYIDQTINGISVGEFGQFALCAAEVGIPAIFASGDEAFCQEAMRLTPGIITVAVKRGLTPDDGLDLDTDAYMHHNLAAVHLHPEVARNAIRDRAQAAIVRLREERDSYPLVRLDPPYERVTLFRPDKPGGHRSIDRATHPDSISALLNMPFVPVIHES